MKKSKIKPIVAGTSLIIPVVALIGGAKVTKALPGIKSTANKITVSISKIPGKTTLKNPGIKLNVNKINISTNKSSINNSNKVNKVNSTTSQSNNQQTTTSSGLKKIPAYNPSKGQAPKAPTTANKTQTGNKLTNKNETIYDEVAKEPVYENIDSITLQQKIPAYNPSKGQAPKAPTTANKTQTGNKLTNKNETIYDEVAKEPVYENIDSITLQQKRPAYNPNKGQAPKPNANKTTNKLTSKKNNAVYDKVADDEPIYNDGSSLMKKPTLNKTQSPSDDEHIYETID